MPRIMRHAAVALALALPAAAEAQGLGREPEIVEGLFAAAAAYEIGDKCPSLDARILQGIGYLQQLRGRAIEIGYTPAEVEAFLDDDAEKDRLEAVARERLAGMGAVEGDAESYCALGRAEMAQGSVIGQLLSD